MDSETSGASKGRGRQAKRKRSDEKNDEPAPAAKTAESAALPLAEDAEDAVAEAAPKRPKQLQHAAWFFEDAKVYDYSEVLDILRNNGCTDLPERAESKRWFTPKTSDGQEFGVGFFHLGKHSFQTHFCTPSIFTWSRDYGQPNPKDVKWGPSLWHVFVSGDDVELDGVEDAEHDTTHFLYTGIAKWRSAHQGPAPDYLPVRCDFDMLRPKSISSDVIEKIGEHLVRCKKNKYGSSLCFIGAEADSKRYGSSPVPSIASSSSVAPPKPSKSDSLGGLALKEEPSLSMSSTVIAKPPAGVTALLEPVALPELTPGRNTTFEALEARDCVHKDRSQFWPTVEEPVLCLNSYGLKEKTETILSDALAIPEPAGITVLFERDHMTEVFKYVAAYAAQKAPALTIWAMSMSACLPDSCTQELIAALQDPRCRLEHLKFYRLAPTPLGMKSIFSAIDSYGKLKSLDFSHVELSNDDLHALCSMSTKLSHLALVECKIQASGSEILANYIQQNAKLKVLDLTSNPIDHEGAVFLGPAIAASQVEFLNLSRTGIGAKGAIDMLKALKGKSKVQNLNLDFVKLGTTGAAALADFLPHSQVSHLSLASTGIPHEKWSTLQKGFEGAKSLKSVVAGKTEEKMETARQAIAKYKK